MANEAPASVVDQARRNEGVVVDARGANVFSGPPHGSLVPSTRSSEEIVAAARELETLKANPEWGAKVTGRDANGKIVGVDKAAYDQFKRLTAIVADASPADLAMAGIVPAGHTDVDAGVGLRETISAVADMRALGLGEDVIRQSLEMLPVSRAEHEMAGLKRRELFSNKEWLQRLHEGDVVVKRQQKLLSIILASPIRES